MSVEEQDLVPERGGAFARRLGLVLGLSFFLGILFWPGLPLDPKQRRLAAITALTATLWVTVALPIGATSLLPAVLLPALGVMSAGEVAPLYMHDLVLLFLGAFIIALGIERWGLHRRIALRIVTLVGTEPRRLVLGFMAAAAFLSMWISNTAATLLMLPIGLAVIGAVHGDEPSSERHRFGLCLLLGSAYGASMGGVATPVGTGPNQVFLGILESTFPDAPKISFGEWTLAWAPFTLLFIPLAWLLLTRVLLPLPRGLVGARDTVEAARRAQGPISRGECLMAAVFVVTAVLWLTRADLDLGFVRMPGWSRLLMGAEAADPAWYAAHEKDVSDATVALFMALLCFAIPVDARKGVFLMDWKTATRLPWEVLLLFGAGFCLAGAFGSSGLDRALGEGVAPLLEGRSAWIVVPAVALFLSFLTELTSNTATTAVLLPVGASAAAQSGLNPLLVMVPATIAASAAFMLPVATPPNAVVFASRLVPAPTMARVGFWLNLLTVVLIALVFQLWVRRVWGIELDLPGWAAAGG